MIPRFLGKSTSTPTRLPSTVISPLVGVKKPQMHFIRTVFPEPLFPMIPWILPLSKFLVTSKSTCSLAKNLDIFFTTIADSI